MSTTDPPLPANPQLPGVDLGLRLSSRCPADPAPAAGALRAAPLKGLRALLKGAPYGVPIKGVSGDTGSYLGLYRD